MSKLTCIYRACGSELKEKREGRPLWFDKKNCFLSFLYAFNNPNTQIIVVWDGDTDNELYRLVKSYETIQVIEINEKNNQKSLLKCYEIAKNDVQSEFVGFFEDDYLFCNKSGDFTINALEHGYDPLTLYNHPDRYISNHSYRIGVFDMTLGHDFIGATDFGYVRTVESTTCSFFTTKKGFDCIYQDLIDFCNSGVGAPNDRGFWLHFLKKYKQARLWGAIPSQSTHVVGMLPPEVDWEKLNNSFNINS